MNSYQGDATLIADDGTEIPAVVALQAERSGNLGSWSGTTATRPGDITVGEYTLRLSNGREGRVLVTNTTFGLGSSAMNVELAGSGEPPFDTNL